MKHAISQQDLDLLNKGFRATGMELSQKATEANAFAVYCHFIDNPDGTLRWLWPQCGSGATFLKFYHTGTIRAALFSFIAKAAFLLGLQRFIASGSCTLYINSTAANVLKKQQDWALFTGTTGENRKMIVWSCNEKGSSFSKIPLTEVSALNLSNEAMALSEPEINGIVKPERINSINSILVQADLYSSKKWKVPARITDIPQASLQHWLANNLELHPIKTTGWWKSVKRKIEHLNTTERFSPVLVTRLQQLISKFRPDTLIPVAAAHGDFTPWNVRYHGNDIGIIDWELYNGCMPAMFDFFHFIYQDNILIRRNSYADIRQQIDTLLSVPEWRSFIDSCKIPAKIAEELYLIHTVTYYLDLYNRQEKWHEQINWLLQVWMEALGSFLHKEALLPARDLLLEDTVHFLKHTSYAALKFDLDDIKKLPVTSDLDLCMDRKDAKKFTHWLRKHELVTSFKERRFSFMTGISLVLAKESMLHIDCIWNFKRKELCFMDIEEVLQNTTVLPCGIKTTSPLQEVKYVWLFHLLNKSSVDRKHRKRFEDNLIYNIATDILIRRYKLDISREALFSYSTEVRKKIVTALRSENKSNRGVAGCKNVFGYFVDCIRRLKPGSGYLITFSGVDGAGKSTVIESIAGYINKELRMPVVVLRHRPSILPIISAWKYGKAAAEERSVKSLPRTGNEQAGLKSLLRFAYYFTDYLFGQFYIYVRYVSRGYAVLYDRYYFDFINDSKRSNILIPSWLSYHLYQFLLKPDFNYFLYAPSDIILQRKQELDEQTINALTDKYLQLFSRLSKQDHSHCYDSICNLDLTTTVNTIYNNIKTKQLCATL